jgi:ribosomal protein L11 methyltransferase
MGNSVTGDRVIGAAGATLWRIALAAADAAVAEAASAALASCAPAVSAFEIEPDGAWRLEAYAESEPNRAELVAALALALSLADSEERTRDLVIEPLPRRDWLRENQESFPPLRIARFFIHGSHVAAVPRAGAIVLRIDAATAFGTGEHATTRGCLLAFDALARRRRFRRPLDMGTGTGVLAMAAARLTRRAVLACDVDPGSVAVARENARINGLQRQVRALRSNGYRHPAIARGRPYDLVLANILARPLARMAGALAAHVEEGGIAILSGLLARQAAYVLAAHRAHRFVLCRRLTVAGWTTLVLRRGSA